MSAIVADIEDLENIFTYPDISPLRFYVYVYLNDIHLLISKLSILQQPVANYKVVRVVPHVRDVYNG